MLTDADDDDYDFDEKIKASSTPLEQAEVFMAFGKYDEAITVLREAIAKGDPQQEKLESKLAEAYNITEVGNHMAVSMTSDPKKTNPSAKWIIVLILCGLISIAGVIYYKRSPSSQPAIPSSQPAIPAVVKPTPVAEKADLKACVEQNADLMNEVSQLKAQLALLQPKKTVSVVRKDGVKNSPAQPPKDASNVPQSPPWNNTLVPSPVLIWLQHN